MSDDDSDWGSDEGEAGAPPPAAAGLAPPPVPKAVVIAPPKPLPPTLIEPESQPLGAALQVLCPFPVQVTLHTGKSLVCGFAVTFNPERTSWTVLLYDEARKGVYSHSINTECEKGKKNLFTAPCLFELQEGSNATIVDENFRGLKVLFQDRSESLKALMFICIAQAATRAQFRLPAYSLVDIARGADKPCKPKYIVDAMIRCWRVQMNAAEPNLTQPLPPHLANFNPTFADTNSLFNATVQVTAEEAPDADMPTKLGQAVGRMCTGGQRLLVVPASSQLSRALMLDYLSEPSHRAVAWKEGYFIILFIQATRVSKAKKEKEKKAKKEKKVPRIVYKEETLETKEEVPQQPRRKSSLPSSIPAAVSLPLPPVPSAAPVSSEHEKEDFLPSRLSVSSSSSSSTAAAAASSSKPSRAPLFSMDDSLPPSSVPSTPSSASFSASSAAAAAAPAASASSSVDLLASLDESVKILSATQSKIVRTLITKSFEAITRDLSLNPPSSVVEEEDDEETANRKSQTKKIIKQHIVNVAALFESANKEPNAGTIRNVVTNWQQYERQVKQEKLGGENSAKANKQIAELQAQVKRLEAEKKTQLDTASATQLKLATDFLSLEEKMGVLRKENEELNKKCQMTEVFEQGMKDMRKILGDETAEKNKLQSELADLLQLQRNFKLTWLPDKHATNCMQCKEKFKTFGSKSKGHCRYCGRLFCQDCCTTSEIPEYGFREKVKICQSCHAFRRKLSNEAGGGGSDDKDD